MIVLTEAVEPKVESARSVYSAIIVDIKELDGAFTRLQIYCPDIMPGVIKDAKNYSDNWVEAPKSPHNGADAYKFEIGGLILISYENGDIRSPQFVRFIKTSDKIINKNRSYVNGTPVTSDKPIVGINSNLSLGSDILQKAIDLLPALYKCGNENIIRFKIEVKNIFGRRVEKSYEVLRCGLCGTEFVRKKTLNLGRYDYISFVSTFSDSYGGFKDIVKSLMEIETPSYNLINNVINKAIYTLEDNKENVTKYDFNNIADRLFWWCTILGYVYAPNNQDIDNSSTLDASFCQRIRSNKLYCTEPVTNSNLEKIFNNFYTRTYDPLYGELDDELSKKFINYIWGFFCSSSKLSANNEFVLRIVTKYSTIMTNTLNNFKTTYSNDTTVDNNIVVQALAVIATSFSSMRNTLNNLHLFIDNIDQGDSIINIANTIIENIKNNSLGYNLAENLTRLYFYNLIGSDMYNDISDDIKSSIKNPISNCLDYFRSQTTAITPPASISNQIYVGYAEDSNEAIVWNFFIENGFSEYVTAAFMGSISAESNFSPNNLQNSYNNKYNLTDEEYTKRVDNNTYKQTVFANNKYYNYTNTVQAFSNDKAGYGLCQWTYWSRKEALYAYAKIRNTSISDINMQLNFILKELQENPNVYRLTTLQNPATKIKEASRLITQYYEAPAAVGAKATESQKNTCYTNRYNKSVDYYTKFTGKTYIEN